ncbi:MAG: tetratricopeptide repeat protein [Verrucomicrobiota bacterium]|nr:tetratricopeptide repeat protein [Verrucomicrobiota bacterium]
MRKKDKHILFNLILISLITIPIAYASNGPAKNDQSDIEPTVTYKESELLTSVSSLYEKKQEAAIKQLRTQITPQSSAALDFALAAMLAKEDSFPLAIESLKSALKKFPFFQRAWLLLGRVNILHGDTQKAVKPLRKALELGADQQEVYKLLAYSHLAEGHVVASESAYSQVLILAPEDKEALAGLARSLFMQERYTAATPLLKILCEKNPDVAEYWVLRANIAMGQNKNNKATIFLECARTISTINNQSLLMLGDLYFNEKLYEKAVSCYKETLALNSLSTTTYIKYAEALLNVGKSDLAQQLLDNDLQKNKKEWEHFHIISARIAETRQDLRQMKIHLDAALSINPMSGDALLMLGKIQKKEGKEERAFLTFERILRIDSHKRRALLEIAQLYVDRSEYKKAVEKLEEAQSIQFDSGVGRYLERLRRGLN